MSGVTNSHFPPASAHLGSREDGGPGEVAGRRPPSPANRGGGAKKRNEGSRRKWVIPYEGRDGKRRICDGGGRVLSQRAALIGVERSEAKGKKEVKKGNGRY